MSNYMDSEEYVHNVDKIERARRIQWTMSNYMDTEEYVHHVAKLEDAQAI